MRAKPGWHKLDLRTCCLEGYRGLRDLRFVDCNDRIKAMLDALLGKLMADFSRRSCDQVSHCLSPSEGPVLFQRQWMIKKVVSKSLAAGIVHDRKLKSVATDKPVEGEMVTSSKHRDQLFGYNRSLRHCCFPRAKTLLRRKSNYSLCNNPLTCSVTIH
jgi:hypothetical protein